MSYKTVMNLERKRRILLSAQDALYWDQAVTMPEKGIEMRAEQYEVLSSLAHEILVSRKFSSALAAAEKEKGLDEFQQANIREMRWIRDRAATISTELVKDISGFIPKSHKAWSEAKNSSDFSVFSPFLERFVDLKKRQASQINPHVNPYEVLIQEFEPSVTLEGLRTQFAAFKDHVVPLFVKIKAAGIRPNLNFLKKNYSVRKQDILNQELARSLGLDFRRGRLDGRPDPSFHPFTNGTYDDVRISTRYLSNNPLEGLLSTIHEAGHAMYEQGLPKGNEFTPVGSSRSLGIHESQSLLWENHVGKSLAFWQGFFPRLAEVFSSQLKDYSAETFYAAVNNVEPDLIRVESNEVTFNLHVLLRFELEEALMNGWVKVKELPEVWNAKMKEYIGIAPKNDAEGVLQDVHWSDTGFGYFPTYTLGTMWAAQIYRAAENNISHLEDKIRAGEFAPLKAWLNENIHVHGSLYLTDELITKATGKAPGAEDFVAYLKNKFATLYKLE